MIVEGVRSAASGRYAGHSEAIVEETVACVKDICRQASLIITEANSRNIGLFLGTTFSNFDLRFNNFEHFSQKGLKAMNPAHSPKGLLSYIGGQVCIACNIKGMQATVSSGFSSGLDSLFEAICFLKRNKENKAIVVELQESFAVKPSCAITGNCCLVLENGKTIQEPAIVSLSSFFEKDGRTDGAVRAIREAVEGSSFDISRLNYVYVAANSYSDSQLCQISECVGKPIKDILDRDKIEGNSAVLLLDKIFNDKQKGTGIIVHIGQEANSGCIVIK